MKISWKVCIVICLVIFPSLTDAKGRPRNQRMRARVDPALCRPEVAPFGCLPVPRDCDVIDLQTFERTINGHTNSAVWRMDAAGYELDFPTLVLQMGFEVNIGQGTARAGYKFRQGREPGSNCTLFTSNGTLASSERAIMDFDFGLPPPIGFSPIRHWFVSNNPDKYILEFGCNDRNQVINGVCYYRWYIHIILREGQLDNPPMRELVWELWQKFGLKFDDPRNTFLWVGYECPDDVLP